MRSGAPYVRTKGWNVKRMARDPRFILNASHSDRVPSCFESKQQYQEYMYWKRLSLETHLHRGVCADCTPEFKERMLSEGRCDHPETVFVQHVNRFNEVETVGVAMNSKWWKRVMKGQYVFKAFKEKEEWGDVFQLDEFLKSEKKRAEPKPIDPHWLDDYFK